MSEGLRDLKVDLASLRFIRAREASTVIFKPERSARRSELGKRTWQFRQDGHLI